MKRLVVTVIEAVLLASVAGLASARPGTPMNSGELRPMTEVEPAKAKAADRKARPIPGTVVYRSSFDKGKTDGWSSSKALPLDRDKGRFHRLHNQTVRLSLPKLPAHEFLHLRLDLYLVESWDGSGIVTGDDVDVPDKITIKLAGGRTLLHATFAVVDNCLQSYPDNDLWAKHPARTGAAAYFKGGSYGASLYSLALSFPHSDRKAALEFTGHLVEARLKDRTAENESWGIGGVVVSALPKAPVALDGKRFGQLWADLTHKDPVKANQAVWTLISAGQAAVPHIEKALSSQDRGVPAKRIADLIRQLDDDDWRVRQKATDELKRIGSPAHRLLNKTLAGKPSPEVQSRIEDILAAGKDTSGEKLRLGRTRWVLQVIGGKRADAMLKTLPPPRPFEPVQPAQPPDRPPDLIRRRGAAPGVTFTNL